MFIIPCQLAQRAGELLRWGQDTGPLPCRSQLMSKSCSLAKALTCSLSQFLATTKFINWPLIIGGTKKENGGGSMQNYHHFWKENFIAVIPYWQCQQNHLLSQKILYILQFDEFSSLDSLNPIPPYVLIILRMLMLMYHICYVEWLMPLHRDCVFLGNSHYIYWIAWLMFKMSCSRIYMLLYFSLALFAVHGNKWIAL